MEVAMAAEVTPAQVKAALSVVMVLGETIRDLGRPVPSGELYAHVAGHLDHQMYTKALDLLLKTGLVRQDNHVLTWAGPAK
jgi:hypothetical protein